MNYCKNMPIDQGKKYNTNILYPSALYICGNFSILLRYMNLFPLNVTQSSSLNLCWFLVEAH